jgi:hypothetical protein
MRPLIMMFRTNPIFPHALGQARFETILSTRI